MRQWPPTVWLWLIATAATSTALAAIGWVRSDDRAFAWMAAGVAVSVATLLASRATALVARVGDKPLSRLVVQTSVRLAIPLGALLALAIARRDLLTGEFLLYFLPFQFVTIVADAGGTIRRVQANIDTSSGTDA